MGQEIFAREPASEFGETERGALQEEFNILI
jgi:hypothetical protein